MQKRALLALLIAAVFMFSGCALIVTDTEKDNARVVLSVNGETMSKGTIAQIVDYTVEQNTYYNDIYAQLLGSSAGLPTTHSAVLRDVLEEYTVAALEKQKAEEMGYNVLSDEDKAEVAAAAEEEYEAMLASIQSSELADSENEGDALREEAIAYAEEQGFADLQYIIDTLSVDKANENMKADLVKDVTVSDEELQEELNARAETEKADYEATLSDYGYAVNNGQTTYYAPAGYRYVKQILIKYSDEEKEKISSTEEAVTLAEAKLSGAEYNLENAEEGADLDELQAAVDAAKATVEKAQADYEAAKGSALTRIGIIANKVHALAVGGEDFDTLIETYNEDTGMVDNETGYAVCEDYIYFDDAFMSAAMSLEQVGDISEPTEGSYGYYIVRYEADIPEGVKDLEEVREELTAEMLAEKQAAHYDEIVAQWRDEADIQTYPEKMGY